MTDRQQFSYVPVRNQAGETGLKPLLPVRLQHNGVSTEINGLLDSGSDVNVLPYRAGLELGFVWNDQQTSVQLSGNLGNYNAKGVILEAVIADFPVVRLVFAWTEFEYVPLILGQVNFFLEFDVCFFRSSSIFEIGLRTKT